MENVEGKTAFVTGGASGIGLSMAKAFLRAGMKVAIGDLRKDRLEQAEVTLKSLGDVLPIELDVADRGSMEKAADEIEAAFQKVHIVFNNAGIGAGGKLHEVTPEAWKRVLDINLGGVFNGVQVFVPRIKRHGEGGHIVNTASMTGLVPIPGSGQYGVSKAAVGVFSEILREDLAGEGISVSVLAPWIVFTPIFHGDLADGDREGIAKRKEQMAANLGDSLTDPDVVGEMVLDAIRRDELYIFNDPVSRRMFEQRIGRIYEALDRQFPGK